MLREEAHWLRAEIESLGVSPGTRAIDLGSSSAYFRGIVQPYIDYEVFAPLRRAGVTVTHVDGRPDEGVDVVGDIASGELPSELYGTADLLLCTNLLEHVTDRRRAVSLLHRLIKPDGALLVTVPHRYPYHPDPIDTGYRPTPEELAQDLAPHFSCERTTLLTAGLEAIEIADGTTLAVAGRMLKMLGWRLRNRVRRPPSWLVSAAVARPA